MDFHISRHLLGCCIGVALMAVMPASWADMEQDRAEGIAWLLQNQNGDGSWGQDGAKIATTSEALEALRNSGANKGYIYTRAISWLANVKAESVDALARKIIALEEAGFDTQSMGLIDDLISKRNDTLAWGGFDGFHSGSPDTPLAMLALLSPGVTYSDINYAANQITLSRASTSVGWPYMGGLLGRTQQPKILPTAYNLMALSKFHSKTDLKKADIEYGVNWLINSKQQADGSFIDDPQVLTGIDTQTALAALGMKATIEFLTMPITGSVDSLNNAISYLLTRQNLNGSWGNDAMQTALVLRTFPTVVMADTDADGFPDTVEVILGSDPLVSNTRDFIHGNGLDPENMQDTGLSLGYVVVETVVNQVFTYTPQVSGGVPGYVWSIASGSLPSGVSLQSTSTGAFGGSSADPGKYSFSLLVQDSVGGNIIAPAFLRVLALDDLSVDTDGDGIPSVRELTYSSNPLDKNSIPDADGDGVLDWDDLFPNNPSEWADNDGDGIGDNADLDDDNDEMPDIWEIQYGLNPLVGDDAIDDGDFDLLNNLAEFFAGTNPNLADTDGDGVDDKSEIDQGRNPIVNENVIIVIINSMLLN